VAFSLLMPVYIAMLRGINVGGNKRMQMDKLRASFESMGFEAVKSYIQSGNVVFKTKKTSPAALAKKIEKQIVADFGFSSSVIVRSSGEIEAIVVNNPLLSDAGIDPTKLHVMFLSASPSAAAAQQFTALTVEPERCHCGDNDIYLYLPNGVSQSVLFKSPVDRILAVTNTTRNWKTVTSLRQMCQECC
jgi:uncharacterized protein (DUF1697 family)